MKDEVTDVRAGERLILSEPLIGSFGSSEIYVLDIGPSGLRIAHRQPLRIGVRKRMQFQRDEVVISAQATVVWSHLARTANGMTYTSGLHVDPADPQLAGAMAALSRLGVLHRDAQSLEKKRARVRERQTAQKAHAKSHAKG